MAAKPVGTDTERNYVTVALCIHKLQIIYVILEEDK